MSASQLGRDAARFGVAGGLNTAVTTLVYFSMLTAFSPAVSYGVSWVIGLLFVMVTYPDRVFKSARNGLFDRMALGGIFLFVFFVGLLLLQTLVHLTGRGDISFVLTLGSTTVLSFFLSRALLRRELL